VLASSTILLVEDEIDDAELLTRAFRKAEIGNPIRHLEDGEMAIAYLAGHKPYADRERNPYPTVILLDLKLPRRSGFEVLEWLRSQPGLRRLPVVVLTSSGQTEDVNRAYDLGANSYLVKPASAAALHEMVKHINAYWVGINRLAEVNRSS
jgi:CheY-like chemotaxis protein